MVDLERFLDRIETEGRGEARRAAQAYQYELAPKRGDAQVDESGHVYPCPQYGVTTANGNGCTCKGLTS